MITFVVFVFMHEKVYIAFCFLYLFNLQLTKDCQENRKVSLPGVDSLWGDFTLIPADWGSE